ncbi:MAG TPA: DegV family protein [Thermoleophilaceae bacterium]|nr:DegV family protein [Thermoleophilaceae bacterium]
MPVAIVADSTGYLPPERIERHSITVVPLYIVFGSDRTEREDLITDYPAYFEELRSAESLPGTSQPSVGDFVAAYEPLLEQGYDIASVHISEGLSGTGQSARQAAEQLEREGKGGERVRVLDSRTAAGGTGLMVLAAAKAAEDGGDLDAVEANMEAARADFKMWFAVDTLEFLRRGGRIGAANAWIGSTLKIKPILTVESELVPVERVRTAKRSFERLVDYARQRHESGADGWVVQHISALDQAEALIERCREIFGCDPVFVSEVGPVVSTHAGPGMLGVGSVPRGLVPA